MEEKYESYFNNINVPNFKNVSSGIRGVMGGGGGNGNQRGEDTMNVYAGVLPNLNNSKRECNVSCIILMNTFRTRVRANDGS